MAKLEVKKQKEIDKIINESSDVYGNGAFEEAIGLLELAWAKLPEPKFIYDDSYHIARFITLISIEIKNFKKAREWAFTAKECDPERQEIGEKEFLIGQVAYESGDMIEAKKYFEIANKISQGLCFQEENIKYKKLIQ